LMGGRLKRISGIMEESSKAHTNLEFELPPPQKGQTRNTFGLGRVAYNWLTT
jgi:hypothetical protein